MPELGLPDFEVNQDALLLASAPPSQVAQEWARLHAPASVNEMAFRRAVAFDPKSTYSIFRVRGPWTVVRGEAFENEPSPEEASALSSALGKVVYVRILQDEPARALVFDLGAEVHRCESDNPAVVDALLRDLGAFAPLYGATGNYLPWLEKEEPEYYAIVAPSQQAPSLERLRSFNDIMREKWIHVFALQLHIRARPDLLHPVSISGVDYLPAEEVPILKRLEKERKSPLKRK